MKKVFLILILALGLSGKAYSQIGWWTSSDTLNVFNKNKGAVLIGSYQPLGKLTVGPDDKFYNLSLVGDYNNLAKNYLQIGVTGRGFENLQGQTLFDLYHSNTQFKNAGYNFRINGQSQFFINGEGNIGIGTEKPEAKLDLSGGPNWGGFNKAIHIPINHAVHFDAGTNQFGLVAQNNELNVVLSNGGSSPFGGSFAKLLTLLPRKMIIEGDIEVRGKIYSQGQVSNGGDVIPIKTGGGPVDNGGGSGKGGGVISNVAVPVTGSTNWQYDPAISATNIFYNNGNVGIGTNNPGYMLELKGNGNPGVSLSLNNSQSGKAYLLQSRNNGNFQINDGTSTTRLAIDPIGNVGIGTVSPTQKLEVVGNVKITGTAGVNGIYFPDGTLQKTAGAGGGSQWTTGGLNIYYNTGSVGIGTANPGTDKLAVNGTIRAQELYLTTTGWSDFVFEQGYNLRTLKQVENYINKNGHLPEIPSQKEVAEKGVGVIDMQTKLLQKIEELTLYVIDQNKRLEKQELEIKSLREHGKKYEK